MRGGEQITKVLRQALLEASWALVGEGFDEPSNQCRINATRVMYKKPYLGVHVLAPLPEIPGDPGAWRSSSDRL